MTGSMWDESGPRLVVIAGPTGVGKSELAMEVAERLGGEIINADSMQLYRGMDIGTAKIRPAERRGIPHHLLDVLDITETASVAAYQRQARARVEEIVRRGAFPVLVGGSGLYIRAVIDEISFPGTDPAVRARLTAELDRVGTSAMFRRLQAADPAAASAVEPNNARRIVRALEVMEVTGRPFVATLPSPGRARYGAILVRLDRATVELDPRLEARVTTMVANGFLEEVRALDHAGLRRGVTASRALGYRQLLDVIDGKMELAVAMTSTTSATRRFVRRQRSWFRRDHRMIDIDAADISAGDQIMSAVRR